MAIKNSQRFSELEFCLSNYFDRYFAPVMTSVRADLQKKQADEIGSYQNSAIGILNSLADASHNVPGVDTSITRLQITGKWNSKTTDDYLEMVRKQIADNKSFQKDISVMASHWRKAVIDEVGRTAYDNASRQIGADLAYAYIGYRFEEQMLGKMVNDQMPKSSIEYVLRKAGERSILGLSLMLNDCPADREINIRIEAKYKPTTLEKGATRAAAFGMDLVAMGGVSSWSSLAKMACTEVVFAGLEAYGSSKKKGAKTLSVEECISQGVFGSKTNVFTGFRKDAYIPRTWERPNLIAINKQLSKKLGILESKPMFADNNPLYHPELTQQKFALNFPSFKSDAANREGIPSVIAIGKEDEYRRSQEALRVQQSSKTKAEEKPAQKNEAAKQEDEPLNLDSEPTEEEARQTDQPIGSELDSSVNVPQAEDANLNGWDGLLKTFGLNGLSGTGQNLGYVIAMLPDVLFGALTGKTKNLGLEDNLIPIASVIAGLFIKNPLLKMTLVGLGGANLLNKAGKEVLTPEGQQGQQVQPVQSVRYKQYADEPLNPRMAGVSIQGNALICTIDRVPSTISLPPAAVAAYEAGSLPLNTLANAILVRHDAMQNELAMQYQQQYEHAHQQALSSGIK